MAKAKKTVDKVTAQEIEKRLFDRFGPKDGYQKPEWVFLPQVRDSSGFDGRRTADGVAMNLWPSRGHEIHGFEIKVSRGDWLKEMKQPAKAEAFFDVCHRWWIVAPKGLIHPGELPIDWGLMETNGDGLKVRKQAKMTDTEEPSRGFIAALLRRAMENVLPQAQMAKKVREARSEGYKEGREMGKEFALGRLKDVEKKLENAEKFERLSGIRLSWCHRLEEDARAFKVVSRELRNLGSLSRLADQIRRQREILQEALDKIEGLKDLDLMKEFDDDDGSEEPV